MEGGAIAIFIVLIVFGSIASIVVLPFWFKERTKQSAHKLIQEAVAKGQPLDKDVIDRLILGASPASQQQGAPRRSLGNGLVLLFLGAAFAGVQWFSNHDFDGGLMWPAMILGCLGAAFTILAIVDYASQKKTDK